MKSSVNVLWDSNMKFVTALDGHQIVLDANVENGGNNKGPRPKALMMVASAGCTGMDVISILKKMRVNLTYFNVRIEGDIREEHPKKFERMKIIYEIKGVDIDYEKVKKAVDLSVERYCGVNANYRDSMVMDYEIVVL
jgi:putative redox protein